MEYKLALQFLICTLLLACKPSVDDSGTGEIPKIDYPPEIKKMFDAHGGLQRWKAQASLSYHLSTNDVKEFHTIDLKNRKVLINGDGYDLGFDGQNVWIAPDNANFQGSSPRFYHNLYFYFHCLVFLVADEGIRFEKLGLQSLGNSEFLAYSMAFEEGVGDSPEDEYILYLNPASYQLEQIKYTVTYFSGQRSDKYNGLKYTQWLEKDGLLLPLEIKGYTISDSMFDKERFTASFSEIVLSTDPPDNEIFMMPEIAVIDTLSN